MVYLIHGDEDKQEETVLETEVKKTKKATKEPKEEKVTVGKDVEILIKEK